MPRSKHLDISTELLPDQWAKVLDPQYMSYKRVREVRDLLKGRDENDMPTEDLIAALVIEWHVSDMETEGEWLEGKPTAEDVENANVEVLMGIIRVVGDMAETLVPKDKPSTS